MFKKIALVGIFALVSVVSFGTPMNSASASTKAPSIASPVVKGLCSAYGCK